MNLACVQAAVREDERNGLKLLWSEADAWNPYLLTHQVGCVRGAFRCEEHLLLHKCVALMRKGLCKKLKDDAQPAGKPGGRDRC